MEIIQSFVTTIYSTIVLNSSKRRRFYYMDIFGLEAPNDNILLGHFSFEAVCSVSRCLVGLYLNLETWTS